MRHLAGGSEMLIGNLEGVLGLRVSLNRSEGVKGKSCFMLSGPGAFLSRRSLLEIGLAEKSQVNLLGVDVALAGKTREERRAERLRLCRARWCKTIG